MKPAVSIIIPSYNHKKYLVEAIRSVLNQTFKDLELVVLDDGSSDGSRELLGQLKAQITDPRLKIFLQENQGAPATIENGIRNSSAPLIGILNSDDRFHPKRVEKLLEVLKSQKREMCFSGVAHIDENGFAINNAHPFKRKYDKEVLRFQFLPNPSLFLLEYNLAITTGNFFFTRKLHDRIGPFRNYKTVHDWDFLLRALLYTQPYYLRETLLDYRIHSTNTISTHGSDVEDCKSIIENYFRSSLGKTENPLAPSLYNYGRAFQFFVQHSRTGLLEFYLSASAGQQAQVDPLPSPEKVSLERSYLFRLKLLYLLTLLKSFAQRTLKPFFQ